MNCFVEGCNQPGIWVPTILVFSTKNPDERSMECDFYQMAHCADCMAVQSKDEIIAHVGVSMIEGIVLMAGRPKPVWERTAIGWNVWDPKEAVKRDRRPLLWAKQGKVKPA